MKIDIRLFIFPLFFFLTEKAIAQGLMNYQEPKEYVMPPKSIPTERRYWISLPKNYYQTNVSYPVIFVFDGNEQFLRELVLSTADYLTEFHEIPPCIIVGLIQRNRALDFAPLYAVKGHPNSDKVNGDKFHDFLKDELTPELNKKYRIQNFRIGIGHSLGGLFLTHSFTKNSGFFNGIVAASPALELQRDSTLFANLKSTLNSTLNTNSYFYWGSGSVGVNEVAFKPGSMALKKVMDENLNVKFSYSNIDLPGRNHNTTPLFTVANGLTFIFKDWNASEWYKALFDNKIDPEQAYAERKQMLKEKYNFDAEPNEDNVIDNIGCQLIEWKRYDKAKQYIEKAIQINPNIGGYYKDLSDVYDKMEKYPEAINYLKFAISRLDKASEDYPFTLEKYEKDLKRIEALNSKPQNRKSR